MKLVRDIRDITAHRHTGAAPALRYREVAAPARLPARPPPFLLGPANAELMWEIFGATDLPSAGCYEIEAATVAPTGIAIKDGVAFASLQFQHPTHHVTTVCDRLNAEHLPVRHVPGPLAILYGPAHETWGHWLTDFLPRLWVLHAAGHDLARLHFLLPPDLRPFARTLLSLCGISPAQCVTYAYWRELIHTDHLLMPTGLRVQNRLAPCFADATVWWTQRARAAAGLPAGTHKRLILSRRGAPQSRQMENRAEIEAIGRAAGYHAVSPEDLSVAEQIALFSGAEILVGEYGSALHNAVFGAAGMSVCGLRGTSRHPSFIQTGIATALRQDAAYIFGATGAQDVEQRFTISPNLFRRALDLLDLMHDRDPAPCAPAGWD